MTYVFVLVLRIYYLCLVQIKDSINHVVRAIHLPTHVLTHPEISERTPEAVTSVSAAVSESDIRGWFKKTEIFSKETSYYDILEDPSRVFNGDESKFQLCSKSGKVIALRGDKDVYEVAAKLTLTVLFTFGDNDVH